MATKTSLPLLRFQVEGRSVTENAGIQGNGLEEPTLQNIEGIGYPLSQPVNFYSILFRLQAEDDDASHDDPRRHEAAALNVFSGSSQAWIPALGRPVKFDGALA